VTQPSNFFRPSEQALEFGAQYARVLAAWAELFTAASTLVDANVTLGQMSADAATELEKWMQTSAAAPWNWMSPEVVQRFMSGFAKPAE
jgi:hypothetical protein